MDSDNPQTGPTKPSPGDAAELAAYVTELLRAIEARLREWLREACASHGPGKDGMALFPEVLALIEWPGHCLGVIDFPQDGGMPFSNREAEVGEHWLNGLSQKEIAQRVNLSPCTVHHVFDRMREKACGTDSKTWGPLRVLARPEVLRRFAVPGRSARGGSATDRGRTERRREAKKKLPAKIRRHRR